MLQHSIQPEQKPFEDVFEQNQRAENPEGTNRTQVIVCQLGRTCTKRIQCEFEHSQQKESFHKAKKLEMKFYNSKAQIRNERSHRVTSNTETCNTGRKWGRRKQIKEGSGIHWTRRLKTRHSRGRSPKEWCKTYRKTHWDSRKSIQGIHLTATKHAQKARKSNQQIDLSKPGILRGVPVCFGDEEAAVEDLKSACQQKSHCGNSIGALQNWNANNQRDLAIANKYSKMNEWKSQPKPLMGYVRKHAIPINAV